MDKKQLLFDGNEKQVFATEDLNNRSFLYKDVPPAYSSIKRARFYV